MNASKIVEENEAFIAEWLKHECLWDVKARAYKGRNARENTLRTLAELFEISSIVIKGTRRKVANYFLSVY